MKETAENRLTNLSRYSVWCALFGILSYLFFFPNGIYYCFFLGTMAVASGILARRSGLRNSRSTAGIVVGIFDLILSMAAYYAMLTVYTSLSDPVMGPKVTHMILQMLEQNGLGADSFVRVMYR